MLQPDVAGQPVVCAYRVVPCGVVEWPRLVLEEGKQTLPRL